MMKKELPAFLKMDPKAAKAAPKGKAKPTKAPKGKPAKGKK